ncbi:phosphate signaling complex protein PhoU [Gordonia defluvii]|uniref:Phosphate-specific transport system accessory protein PhoU n=1 Tax=Gordonia defluvii TaxID=283718 RepID=A0ABP6L4U6_9ACTN|nr:phosphate signaling complex protein PhoU [Gordonia sp. UBA5067]
MRKRSDKESAYQEQVAALNGTLGQMCELAGNAMDRATQALLQANLPVAEEVITDHDQMIELSAKAEKRAFALLAQQAPMPADLRATVTGFQIVANVDRMGALALHVAKVARRRHPNKALPEEVDGYFAEMGRLAVKLAHAAREVLESQDPQHALQLEEDDDAMDDLHRHLFSVLMDREWKHGVAAAVDVTLLGRYYERFADHAVLIGRRVVFQTTGMTPQQLIDTT